MGPHITLWPIYAAIAVSALIGIVVNQSFGNMLGIPAAAASFYPAVKVSTWIIFRVMMRTKSDKQ